MKNPTIFNTKTALKSFIAGHSKYEKMENFNKNINTIIKDIKRTNGKIAIVSDFDYTLTRRFDINNHQVNFFSSYCVLENFSNTSENFKIKNKELFEKYHHYEIDVSIDFETRKNLVWKWYIENFDLILEETISKSHFEEMFNESQENFYFRNGILELFEVILEYKIPFFIISGGLYEVIEHALKTVIPFYNNLEKENLINIIANRFIFDNKNDKIIGYHQPIVYTFNKGEMVRLHFEKYAKSIENIIVLGDHVNDVDSIKELDIKNSIKIGFLNSKNIINSPEDFILYEIFAKHYDVGIMNDGTLNFVNHILYDIFSHTVKSKDNDALNI